MTQQKLQRKLSIFQKMFLTMLLVSIVPLSTIWYFNYQSTSSQITTQVDERLTGVVSHLASYVDGWVDMNKKMLLQNAASDNIQSMDTNSQTKVLESITQIYDWNYLAFTVDKDGQNIGRSDGKPLTYYGDRSYVKQVVSGASFGKQVLIGKTSGKPAFVLAAPIKDSKGTVNGVLAIAMTISDLSERITNTRIGETGKAFLMDEQGKIIAHQSPEFTTARKDFSQHPTFKAAMNNQRSVNYVDENGQIVTAYIQTTSDGWIMVAQQQVDEAFASVKQSNKEALILLVITILLVLLIATLLALRLSTPIKNLTRVADEISRGKLGHNIKEALRTDELGALGQSIERLGKSVKFAIAKIATQKKQLTETQMMDENDLQSLMKATKQ